MARLTGSAIYHGFIDYGARLVDLNRLLDSSGNGWTINAGQAINNNGSIAAEATDPTGSPHAVLLTPVARRPPPPIPVGGWHMAFRSPDWLFGFGKNGLEALFGTFSVQTGKRSTALLGKFVSGKILTARSLCLRATQTFGRA